MTSNTNKVLLIGVTGGTGKNVVKGFLEQGFFDLRAITRKIDLSRSDLSKLSNAGVELVEADLDDAASLGAALAGISAVYCHGLSADAAKPDPQEIARAHRLARAAHEGAKVAKLHLSAMQWLEALSNKSFKQISVNWLQLPKKSLFMGKFFSKKSLKC